MKKTGLITLAFLMAVSGVFAQVQPKVDRKGTKNAGIVYTCPMHPDVKSDKPGKCPKCGMTLVAKKMGDAATGKAKKDSSSMKGMKN